MNMVDLDKGLICAISVMPFRYLWFQYLYWKEDLQTPSTETKSFFFSP